MKEESGLKNRHGISLFLGTTYRLDQSKNYENFLYKVGASGEVARKANNLKPSVKLTRKNMKYTLTTTIAPEKTHKLTFELGKEVTRPVKSGSRVTSVFFVTGNKLEETQSSIDGTIVVTRTFRPEHLIVEMSTCGEKCQRFYKRVPKPDEEDIRTETSRRSIDSISSENLSLNGESGIFGAGESLY